MKRKKHKNTSHKKTPMKMSEILLNYAWGYAIEGQTDPKQRQHFMNVACTAWNCSLLPDEDCHRTIANFVNNMGATGGLQADDANMLALSNDLHNLVEYKREHYSLIRKLVVSAELFDEGGTIRCKAASTDFDAMVKARQTREL